MTVKYILRTTYVDKWLVSKFSTKLYYSCQKIRHTLKNVKYFWSTNTEGINMVQN